MKISAIFSLAFLALLAQSAVLPEDDVAEVPEVDVVAVAQRSVLESMEEEVSDALAKRDFGFVADLSFSIHILSLHNIKRLLHGCPILNWDSGCYKHAKKYVDNYDCSGNFHGPNDQYGGNWGQGDSKPFTVLLDAGVAFDKWYSVGKGINFGKSISIGAKISLNSFTTLIWKSTRRVGCAYKDCRSKGRGYFYYCNYDPYVPNPSEKQCIDNILPAN